MGRLTYIYALSEPETGAIRYVGKTSRSPAKRLAQHICRTSLTPKRHSCRWIAGLVNRGLKPAMEVLEIVPDDGDWQAAERRWISYYRESGASLVNLTDGGEGVGGYVWPSGRREEMRQRFKGRQFDDEWRAKISAAKKGRPGAKPSAETTQRRVDATRATRLKKALAKTHCDQGHELAGANLIQRPPFGKVCKLCDQRKHREAYLRRRGPLVGRSKAPTKAKPPPKQRHEWDYTYGERHPQAKLTWEKVDAMRARVAAGEARKAVAADYGVALTTVDQIIQGKCWRPETRLMALKEAA